MVALLALTFLYVAALAVDDWLNGFETRTVAVPGAGETIVCHDDAVSRLNVADIGLTQDSATPPASMFDECRRQHDRFTSVRWRLSVLALGLAGCLALAVRRSRSPASR